MMTFRHKFSSSSLCVLEMKLRSPDFAANAFTHLTILSALCLVFLSQGLSVNLKITNAKKSSWLTCPRDALLCLSSYGIRGWSCSVSGLLNRCWELKHRTSCSHSNAVKLSRLPSPCLSFVGRYLAT